MRRIVTWVSTTAAILVLLFGYHTSTAGPGTPAQGVLSAGAVPGAGSTSSGTGSTGGTGGSTGTSPSRAVTGPVAQTRWGPVQIQLQMQGSTIAGISVLQRPTGNSMDDRINSYALPILMQSTLDAQSAKVDMVSGATVTSTGYLQSLQGALDQAGA